MVRGYIDLLDVGELLGIPSSLQEHILKQYVMFRQALGVEAVGVEIPIVTDHLRLAGTADRHDRVTRNLAVRFGERLVNIEAGSTVIGDIKTGKLATTRDGHPKYWVKYGPQIAAYADGVPFSVETEQRGTWDEPPHSDVALLYHYDLSAALDGETVDWQAIPVNLDVAREGVQVALSAKAYAKRVDVFGPPIPLGDDRRERLLEHYRQLGDSDRARFVAQGIDKDDLDAIETALDEIDPFLQTAPIPDPDPDPVEVLTVFAKSARVAPAIIDETLYAIHGGAHAFVIQRWSTEAVADGASFDPRIHPDELHLERLKAAHALAVATDGDDNVARLLMEAQLNSDIPVGALIADATIDEARRHQRAAAGLGELTLMIAEDGTPTITRTPTSDTLFG